MILLDAIPGIGVDATAFAFNLGTAFGSMFGLVAGFALAVFLGWKLWAWIAARPAVGLVLSRITNR